MHNILTNQITDIWYGIQLKHYNNQLILVKQNKEI